MEFPPKLPILRDNRPGKGIGNGTMEETANTDARSATGLGLIAGVILLAVAGCSPTVKVEAPSEPITINLNVKLDADVRLRLIEEAEDDVDSNPIF